MAGKNEYVSAQTCSKAYLEINKAIMSKAHEEGGDLTSLQSCITKSASKTMVGSHAPGMAGIG